MKFKVGDKVIVKNHPIGNCGKEGCQTLVDSMQWLIGETVTIETNYFCHYSIKEDKENWMWSDCMFKKAPIKKVKKIKEKIKVIQKSTRYKISEGNVSITATKDVNGKITLYTRDDNDEFIFINSNPELIKRIAKLIERASEL